MHDAHRSDDVRDVAHAGHEPGAAVLVTSPDGRSAVVHGPEADAVLPGDLVVAGTPAGDVLLQVVDGGSGRVVRPRRDLPASQARFSDVPAAAATVEQLTALQESAGATLPVGTWQVGDVEVPALLRPQGFGRHTFLCGQSGSGKTYALGVLLEQLVLGTGLRVVVLDPNSDFVHLGRPLPEAGDAVTAAFDRAGVRVLGADGSDRQPLRLRYTAMPRAAQAALLRLDPLGDRDEYNVFLRATEGRERGELLGLLAALATGDPAEQALGRRIENLGLPGWQVWAGDDASLPEVVRGEGRVTVADLAGFRDPAEPVAVVLDLLEDLWARREDRTPTLLVVDEAHNVCPAEPRTTVQQAVVDRFVQVAAEGRKYGLWLLLSTQRPSKIHPQVLSQCDNLVLMRMNSPGDVAALADVFGFVPPAVLARAPSFVQGEALVAGALTPVPTLLRMGRRLTAQGGSDVAVPPPR